MRLMVVCVSVLCAAGCSGGNNTPRPNVSSSPANTVKPSPLPVYRYEVVQAYPHDTKAFTEGLFFHDGFLYESTGEQGRSSLRKVEIETGMVYEFEANLPIKVTEVPEESDDDGLETLEWASNCSTTRT